MANHKQEEEALLNEMEVTGQAFEDMQEQNSRLIQQLREKDDANFKLMSERIKSNQVRKPPYYVIINFTHYKFTSKPDHGTLKREYSAQSKQCTRDTNAFRTKNKQRLISSLH